MYICTMRIYKPFILLAILFSLNSSWAQCDSTAVLDDMNINSIANPYQLDCLNQNGKSKLDGLVKTLSSTQDSAILTNTIDKIGALKTKESYCFLFNTCCRPIIIKDLNMFNSLCGLLGYYGGYHALNKYHLDNAVNTKLPFASFAGEVYSQCQEKEPRCTACIK